MRVEGDWEGVLKVGGRKSPVRGAPWSLGSEGETVDPLQLVIKRASVLQISGLSGTAGSKAETLFRKKWALISAFSP